MALLKTYLQVNHHITGNAEIKPVGRRSAPDVSQPSQAKSSRNVWALKHECEAAKQSDSITLLTPAELQRADRRRKRNNSNNLK